MENDSVIIDQYDGCIGVGSQNPTEQTDSVTIVGDCDYTQENWNMCDPDIEKDNYCEVGEVGCDDFAATIATEEMVSSHEPIVICQPNNSEQNCMCVGCEIDSDNNTYGLDGETNDDSSGTN